MSSPEEAMSPTGLPTHTHRYRSLLKWSSPVTESEEGSPLGKAQHMPGPVSPVTKPGHNEYSGCLGHHHKAHWAHTSGTASSLPGHNVILCHRSQCLVSSISGRDRGEGKAWECIGGLGRPAPTTDGTGSSHCCYSLTDIWDFPPCCKLGRHKRHYFPAQGSRSCLHKGRMLEVCLGHVGQGTISAE